MYIFKAPLSHLFANYFHCTITSTWLLFFFLSEATVSEAQNSLLIDLRKTYQQKGKHRLLKLWKPFNV